MPSFNRTNEYAKSENGPEWFNNFLSELSKIVPNNSAASSKIAVEEMTQKYRNDIGLDLIADIDSNNKEIVVQASTNKRHLSKRAENKTPLKDIPKVQHIVESFCRNSGGTKSVYSILNHLREEMGKENVSYSDKELIDYINEVKSQYKVPEVKQFADVGKAGTSVGDYSDSKADYFTNSKM